MASTTTELKQIHIIRFAEADPMASRLRTGEITMFKMRIVIQLLALSLFSTTVYAQIIPSNRVTTWKPGVTNNGGIPNRTTIYRTLSPSGGDDTAAIQAALSGCPPNQGVQLTAGGFKITGNGLSFLSPNCTLRGVGPGQGLNDGIDSFEPNT